jgi:Holliday junction resolvasome RuvABC endonuclease subunit
MWKIAGIDMSVASPSLCSISKSNASEVLVQWYYIQQRKKKPPPPVVETKTTKNVRVRIEFFPHQPSPLSGFGKQLDVVNTVASWVTKIDPSHVVLEGYAYSHNSQVMMETCGILKSKLAEAGMEYQVVPPTKAKKLLANNGRAKKVDMVDRLNRILGINLLELVCSGSGKNLHPAEDMADAFALCLCSPQKIRDVFF